MPPARPTTALVGRWYGLGCYKMLVGACNVGFVILIYWFLIGCVIINRCRVVGAAPVEGVYLTLFFVDGRRRVTCHSSEAILTNIGTWNTSTVASAIAVIGIQCDAYRAQSACSCSLRLWAESAA